MTESKSDPENFNVQRSEFSVQRSGAAGRAVFLSYASQDAEAARRIAESLPPSLKSYGETRRAMPQR